jgi:hypothetical protein
MPDYKKYEKCERKALLDLSERMNRLHADMGGRDRRPERLALIKCMNILRKELERSATAMFVAQADLKP